MARKGSRILLHLVCKECKNQNYLTEKNKVNTTDKMDVAKFCSTCKKQTPHKESNKLK